jgi:hypothetical protein
VLAGVLYSEVENLFGTVNVRAIDPPAAFGTPVVVSPKKLSAEDKVDRWCSLWFRNVAIVTPR